jgi:hypothetical protein
MKPDTYEAAERIAIVQEGCKLPNGNPMPITVVSGPVEPDEIKEKKRNGT